MVPPNHAPDSKHPRGGRKVGANKPNMTALSLASGPAALAARAARSSKCIALAQSLPPKLLRFLARYPSPRILPAGEAVAPPAPTHFQQHTKNPFFPQKNEETGFWRNPVYSSRRQADLVKVARKHGLQDLLPFSTKDVETKLKRKVALGWRGKGTGVGQKVKGHKHERMLGAKYVVFLGGGLALLEVQYVGRFGNADCLFQDGPEERGYAQDAGAHQRMEGGKFEGMPFVYQQRANNIHRLVGRTGPSGPNKGLHSQHGPASAVQIYTQYKDTQTRRCFMHM